MSRPEVKFVLAMLIFGSIGIFVKNIALPSAVIVLWRTIIGALFLGLIMMMQCQFVDWKVVRDNGFKLMIAGVLLGSNWAFLFEAYKHLSVSMATLLYYCAPLIVFGFAVVFLAEKLTVNRGIGIVATVVGMIVINVSAGDSGMTPYGIFLGLAAALNYALLMITNKFIKNLSGLHSTFIQLIIAMFVMMGYVYLTSGQPIIFPDPEDWGLVFVVGALHTGIACYLYFSAIQVLPGQTIAILSYIDPTSALFLSALVLNERMLMPQIIGGLLILGGTALSELFHHNKKADH